MWTDLVGIFARPLAGALAFFYGLTHDYAAAIALLTLAVMLVLFPLTLKGTRSMLAIQRLQPEMKKLQDLHKGDRVKLNEELTQLYRDNKINPLGGCFPLLAQLPVFLLLYAVIHGLTNSTKGRPDPQYLDPGSELYQDLLRDNGRMLSLGFDLAEKAWDNHPSLAVAAPYYLLIVLMVAVQYWSTHITLKRSMSDNSSPQAAMMIKVQKFLPFVFGIFAVNFVAGLVLYWLISALFRVGQTAAIYRFDPQLRSTVAAAKKEASEMIARDSKPARANGTSIKKKATSSSSKSKKKRKGR